MVSAVDTWCLIFSVSIDATSSFAFLIILDLIVAVLRTTCSAASNRFIRLLDSFSEGYLSVDLTDDIFVEIVLVDHILQTLAAIVLRAVGNCPYWNRFS